MQSFVTSIEKLLKQKLNIYTNSLTPKTDLKNDLNLVDWELIYLLNAVEEKWHISIAQNDSENIDNIEQFFFGRVNVECERSFAFIHIGSI